MYAAPYPGALEFLTTPYCRFMCGKQSTRKSAPRDRSRHYVCEARSVRFHQSKTDFCAPALGLSACHLAWFASIRRPPRVPGTRNQMITGVRFAKGFYEPSPCPTGDEVLGSWPSKVADSQCLSGQVLVRFPSIFAMPACSVQSPSCLPRRVFRRHGSRSLDNSSTRAHAVVVCRDEPTPCCSTDLMWLNGGRIFDSRNSECINTGDLQWDYIVFPFLGGFERGVVSSVAYVSVALNCFCQLWCWLSRLVFTLLFGARLF